MVKGWWAGSATGVWLVDSEGQGRRRQQADGVTRRLELPTANGGRERVYGVGR